MNRNPLVIVFCTLFYFTNAQYTNNSISADFGPSISFMDTDPSLGLSSSVAYHQRFENNTGLTLILNYERMRGGIGNLLTNGDKGYIFRSHAANIYTSFDYSLNFGKGDKYEIKPGIGIGIMIISTKGEFESDANAISMYNSWGEEYFEPVYDDNMQVVSATSSANLGAMNFIPSITFSYYPKHRYKIFFTTGYSLIQHDDVDAFNIPTIANQNRDILQFSRIGMGYVIYKKKSFKAR